jgi:trigger factor
LNVVLQRYAADLRSDATQEIIQRCWKQALEQNQLAPLTEPVVKDLKSESGSPLKFTLSFEVLPDVEIKDYQNTGVRLESTPVEDKDIDAALESLRENQAQYVPVEGGEIVDGHVVTIAVDGVFEGGGKPIHEDEVAVVVGSDDTNEAFSVNLRGAKLGEERSFDVTYPEDHHRKRFSGKLVHYRVTIKDIKEKHLPELSDDFAKDLGMEGLAQLRDKVRDDLVTKAERIAEKKAKEAVLDEVIRRNSFDVPDCLVDEELESHARRIAGSLARQGIDVNKTHIDWKKVFEEERPEAEKAVRRSIVLDAIAKQEKIEATEEELEAEFQRLAQGTGKTAVALRAQFEKDNKTHSFREHLRQNKALDFIFRNATISRG